MPKENFLFRPQKGRVFLAGLPLESLQGSAFVLLATEAHPDRLHTPDRMSLLLEERLLGRRIHGEAFAVAQLN